MGVSVEDKKTADERIPILLQIPFVKHFVSVEPALGYVDLTKFSGITHEDEDRNKIVFHYMIDDLDWVVMGCESGPKRRPANIHWFRYLRDQCVNAGVPFFLKQMEVDGKVVKMPALDGKVWDQGPL